MQAREPALNFTFLMSRRVFLTLRSNTGSTYSKHPFFHLLRLLEATFNPSLWTKDVTIWAKDGRVPVKDPSVHADGRAGRNELAVQMNTTFWHVALKHETSARMDPKRFDDDSVPIIQGVVNQHMSTLGMGQGPNLHIVKIQRLALLDERR